jgi:hypothetical protein
VSESVEDSDDRRELLGGEDGTPGPSEQMSVSDPDGYVLMVAQLEIAEAS